MICLYVYVHHSLLIRILASCTQKMMFGAVHKLMTEVMPKEEGMAIGRLSDRTWDIEIHFLKDGMLKIIHNRVGVGCKGGGAKEYLVFWTIDCSILLDCSDVAKSKCTNALLKIEKVEFVESVDALFKKRTLTALGGGHMIVH